jgi:hypothetical protein
MDVISGEQTERAWEALIPEDEARAALKKAVKLSAGNLTAIAELN